MPHQITPSRKKFRIAKKFAGELHKVFGNGLKAVFAAGSVAANMALSESDIDIVFVIENRSIEERKKVIEIRRALEKKTQQEICEWGIESRLFENPTLLFKLGLAEIAMKTTPLAKLKDGAVPVFGDKKYLERFQGKSFNIPNRKAIIGKYSTSPLKFRQRIKFKRSAKGRRRFLPR